MRRRSLEDLPRDLRVAVRREGPPDPEGKCVVYWMQRAQTALDVGVEAANALRKPVVPFLGLVPSYPNANLRHDAFLVQGIPDLAQRLGRRGLGFVLRRYRDGQLVNFCEEVRPIFVVGDENPLRELERWRVTGAANMRVPLWAVDADVIVHSKLLENEQYAARRIPPRIRACRIAWAIGGKQDRAWGPERPIYGKVATCRTKAPRTSSIARPTPGASKPRSQKER